MKRFVSLSLFSVLIICLFSGCAKVKTISNNINENDPLIYSIDKIPDTLKPKESFTVRENDLICSIFEGLVEVNESGEIIPALSKGWKVSDDRIEYTFELRDDIKWSDGKKITSFDFLDFFKYLLTSENSTNTTNELDIIYGAKDFREGNGTFENVAIKAMDNKTLSIRLNNADENFLNVLSRPNYRLRDIKQNLDDYKNQFLAIRYTGPYIISMVTTGNEIVLEKNANYEEVIKGVDKIIIKQKENDEIEFAAYNVGNVDILSNPPITAFSEGNLYKMVNKYPSDNIKFLMFNTNNEIINFLDFRRGLYNALKLEILDCFPLKNNIATWAFREMPYGDLVSGELKKEKVDVFNDASEKENLSFKANELLSKIDTREKTVYIISLNTQENRYVCEFIGKLLKDNYDISSKIKLCTEEELAKEFQEGKYDIYIGDVNLNISQEMMTFLQDKSEFLDKELSMISLYYRNETWCKSDRVKYLFIDGNGNLIFKYIEPESV